MCRGDCPKSGPGGPDRGPRGGLGGGRRADRALRQGPRMGGPQQSLRRIPGPDGPPGLRVQPARAMPAAVAPGEMGGVLTPAAEPAYYARAITSKTFDDRLTASGVLACGDGGGPRAGRILQRGDAQRVADPEHDRPAHPGAGRRVLRLRRVRHEPMARGRRFPPPVRPVRDPKTGKEEPSGFAARGPAHLVPHL